MIPILGLVHLDGTRADPQIWKLMASTFSGATPSHENCKTFQNAIVSDSEPESDDSLGLSFDGDIFSLDRPLREKLIDVIKGDRITDPLDGEYAFGLYDHSQRCVLLSSSPHNGRPLYYFKSDLFVAYSNQIKALLAHPDINSEIDLNYLSNFLVGSIGPETGKTFFNRIHRVMPGEALSFQNGGDQRAIHQTRETCTTKSSRLDIQDFRNLFEESVLNRLDPHGPTAVLVSGGLDSSAIFTAAHQMKKHDCRGYHYHHDSFSEANELEYIESLENFVDRKITSIRVSPEFSIEEMEKDVRAMEMPLSHLLSPTERRIYSQANNEGCSKILSGHWGDQLLENTAYFQDLLLEGKLSEFRRQASGMSRWSGAYSMKDILTNALIDQLWNWTPNGVLKLKNRMLYGNKNTTFYAEEFYRRHESQYRKAKPTGMSYQQFEYYDYFNNANLCLHLDANQKWSHASGLTISHPFMDKKLFDYVVNTPGHHINRNGKPRSLLRSFRLGLLPDLIARRKDKGDYTRTQQIMARNMRDAYLKFLSNETRIFDLKIVDPDRFRLSFSVAQMPEGTTSSQDFKLHRLVNLEIWLKLFSN